MKKISILLSLIFLFVSCTNETVDYLEGVMYNFHPRECKYMWAFNISKTETIVYDKYRVDKTEYVSNKQSVSVQDYALEFTTCNVSLDEVFDREGLNYKDVYESGQEDMLFTTPAYECLWYVDNSLQDASDKIIETKLLEYFKKRTNSNRVTGAIYTVIANIDYRTTPIKDIRIFASADINDATAGESLNDLFVVDEYAEHHDFIITSNKDLITDSKKISKISIDQYLYYRPMAPATLIFKFCDDFDVKAPIETTFMVELTTLDGKVIRSETPSVIITPKAK